MRIPVNAVITIQYTNIIIQSTCQAQSMKQ
jgi:hypothetical protein